MYAKDIAFIYTHLKQSASYKTQADRHKQVDECYQRLLKTSDDSVSKFNAYMDYHELMDEVLDFHNSIIGNSPKYSLEDLKDSSTLAKMHADNKHIFPNIQMNLDSLETVLSETDTKELTGIYHYKNIVEIALYKQAAHYKGIVLRSKLPAWSRGEVIFSLIPRGDKGFRMFMGAYVDKQMLSVPEYFKEGLLLSSGWSKKNRSLGKFPMETQRVDYGFRKLTQDVDYVCIPSFSASEPKLNEAILFYEKLRNIDLAKHLIVDVRGNSGGGNKNSNKLYQILSTYSGCLHVLVDRRTWSNAEQFVIRLKALPNVKVFGDRTGGVLTYGRNTGRELKTPSGFFKIAFTDMKEGWKHYLPYEGIGVEPDVYLPYDSDWIEEVLSVLDGK
ncbi:S41 family peptidase [Sphingobacterium paludis]|nr:S41 family peptidase [Sphingobacterium paludis]